MTGSSGGPGLPRPTTRRWQPLRLGLVDLFYYDDEQFWFHDGRLLLRGNKGTGKSKVLALTLPFLLDGSLAARRVEPDADPKKRMEWNLLMGGAHPATERTGYSWIEFGRVDDDGSEHFVTLGMGIKAAAGRGVVKSWPFTTSRRIGDLRLVDDSRTVLSQERLRAELEGAGQIHPTQEAYRRAVDEALFRLGEERYGALVDLLIQLRQPQLSKRPDERLLSAALTEALAPLDQAVVADVAESFRSLEEERAGIADVRDTLAATRSFLRDYRAYARVATRRRTSSVRAVNSRFEHAGRDLRETETRLEQARADGDRLDADQRAAEEERGALTGRQQALRESPEMRDAEQLDRARRAAADLAHRVTLSEADTDASRGRAERDRAQEADAVRRHDEAVDEAQRTELRALRWADGAGLGGDHEAIVLDADLARRSLARRREQVRHVRALVAAVGVARTRTEQRQLALDAAETAASARAEEVTAARLVVTATVADYRDTVSAYLRSLTAISPSGPVAELVAAAGDWAHGLVGASPLGEAVARAVGAAEEELGRRRSRAEQRLAAVGEQQRQLRDRISELESGRDPEPPAVPGRESQARAAAPGAPLWRLTDFADDLDAVRRAGVEAALQSAGLLDAWVFPDGRLLADGDVVLGPVGDAPPAASALGSVLVPAVGPDAPVGPAAVAAVLARIGLGEQAGAAWWVDPEGRWGAGPARGSWSKPRAEYVGAGAREESRRSLLVALRAELAQREAEAAEARDEMAAADRERRAVAADRERYPVAQERELTVAHERAAGAERELERAHAVIDRARAAWRLAADEADEAATELAESAAELRLGPTSEELETSEAAVASYAEALGDLRHAVRERDAAQAQRAAAAERTAESALLLAQREDGLRELRTQAAAGRAHAEALEETVGASVRELQGRLEQLAEALAGAERRLRSLATAQLTAAALTAQLEERSRELGLRREEAAAARLEVVAYLRSFAATGVLRVALPELEVPDPAAVEDWAVTAALGVARTAEQQLEGVEESDDAWARVQQRMSTAHTELAAQMSRHGHTAVTEQHDEVLVARVRYVYEEIDVDRLGERLADELAERERLLSAREREILENHLVNEVAGHLHELLVTAQGQIDQMNRELVERKTSTGMQLRVLWRERADGPAGLPAARELMLRSDATWTPTDREAIGGFLQAQIQAARQADPAASWQEHLERVLDYRQWHAFVVERRQNGQWRSAAGPASGGERVLAASVPLFAAASSHYNSAGPLAPRLILLDEAFAGVDDDSRSKSLGLLATFDLDVVMTSEREWGCYPEVPGLAIAQLSRVEGIDAVGVTRWRWDGRRRERAVDVGAAAVATAPAARPGHADDGFDLFGEGDPT